MSILGAGFYANRLPTREECWEFMRLVNVGRRAFGLEAIETLEFDLCDKDVRERPNSGAHHCLSARHLVRAIDSDIGRVGAITFSVSKPEVLATALHVQTLHGGVIIPDGIRRVTDPFDAKLPGLRERLVEAGLIDVEPEVKGWSTIELLIDEIPREPVALR